MIKNLIKKLFIKYFLEKSMFNRSDLIYRKNNPNILLEVESILYDRNLNLVTVVKKYGTDQLFSIDNLEILEYAEYKSMPPGDGFELK